MILDFIPVHFAADAHGLRNYDGTALFEYPNNAVGVNEWGSCNFMHSRGETCSFLKSSADFWITEYHFDGLRLDAVSNLIYWQGNAGRGENKNTIDFIRSFNAGLHMRHPGVIICAEDSEKLPESPRETIMLRRIRKKLLLSQRLKQNQLMFLHSEMILNQKKLTFLTLVLMLMQKKLRLHRM